MTLTTWPAGATALAVVATGDGAIAAGAAGVDAPGKPPGKTFDDEAVTGAPGTVVRTGAMAGAGVPNSEGWPLCLFHDS